MTPLFVRQEGSRQAAQRHKSSQRDIRVQPD